ncbi:MAG: aminoacyl-tRNA hydrolase [Alphaproteobacteria bacterium]|nr:aminoacyl-tRNA hydrolase [Alphaproteobacteria bacterium]
MLLFAGLGNPEPTYERHRHNIGFMVIDALAAHYTAPPFRKKHKGAISEIIIGGEKVLLLKPLTYMNLSGESISDAAHFYKLGGNAITIFHDEIDLAPMKLRVQKGGGAAGHNGIKSIIAHLGAAFPALRRVRLGVGRPQSDIKENVSDHVLGNFSPTDQDWLSPLLKALCEYAPLLIENRDALYQTRIAESLKPLKQGDV